MVASAPRASTHRTAVRPTRDPIGSGRSAAAPTLLFFRTPQVGPTYGGGALGGQRSGRGHLAVVGPAKALLPRGQQPGEPKQQRREQEALGVQAQLRLRPGGQAQ